MKNVLRMQLRIGVSLVLFAWANSCEAHGLSGTFRSAPGSMGMYTYHAGEYFHNPVPADVTMTFAGGNVTTMLTAIIHQPIIGVDENGAPLQQIANEFPMVVTGTSANGRDFHGDLLGTQYLFDWSIEPSANGELAWNGQVGWAGGRVEVTTITNVRLLPVLAGDYNHDLTVSAADYVLWRETLGQTGIGLAADGNGNNEVDAGDFAVWRAHFGASFGNGAGSGAAVPEPGGAGVALLGISAAWIAVGEGRRARLRVAAKR